MKTVSILVVTHSAVLYTGLVEICRLIFSSLVRDFGNKYSISQVGLFHGSAVVMPMWPIMPTRKQVLPDGSEHFDPRDEFGFVTATEYIETHQPDIVFVFNDPQHVEFFCRSFPNRHWKLVIYVTIDGCPVPRGFDCLFGADRLLTMSDFSRKALLHSCAGRGESEIGVAYAPADTERFHPVSEEERSEIRKQQLPRWMGESPFVLGWVGRNQWRKQRWVTYRLMQLIRTGNYRLCRRCGAARVHESLGGCGCGGTAWGGAKPIADVVLWMHHPSGCAGGDWPLADRAHSRLDSSC